MSLSPTGGVVKGFGMQLSGAFATTGFINNPILLNMTGSVVVLLYNTSAFTGQAVYFDTTSTSPGVRRAGSALGRNSLLTDMFDYDMICSRQSL